MKLDDVIKRIKVYAFAEKGWSRRALAKQAGISEQTVRDIHKDEWNPTLKNLRELEKVVPDDFVFTEAPKGEN